MSEHHRRLERMYHSAPISRLYEPKLTIREGKTELVLPVKPEFFHAADAVVYDGEGQQIARGSGSFVRSQIKLTPEIGYA